MDSNYVDDLIDDDEIPELTEADFAQMKPFHALPEDLQTTLEEMRCGHVSFRPDAGGEEQVPVPVSRSVVERFQASGSGWESKVDEALRQWLDDHQAS
jgi:uncharacterized protein (DUF4415 family)